MTKTTISVKKDDKDLFDKFHKLCNEDYRRKAKIPKKAFQGLGVADFFAVVIAVAMSHKEEVYDCARFENALKDGD